MISGEKKKDKQTQERLKAVSTFNLFALVVNCQDHLITDKKFHLIDLYKMYGQFY